MAIGEAGARGHLVHVAAGTDSYGGVQRASVLFGRALRGYTSARALGYTRIELANASRWQKIRTVSRTLIAQGARPNAAVFFDHLGLARLQPFVPAALRRPYAVYLHGIEVWRPLWPSAAAALRGASILFSNSDYTQRRAREFLPDLPKVNVVALALIEEQPRGAADEDLLRRAGSGHFIVVGRMHPEERYKGHETVLEALAALRSQGDEARCVFVGEGADRPRLEARAGSLGVGDMVLFAGAVSDATLGALYVRCRALVLPSAGEGFGLVYLEAMRAARPCVAARGSAAEEIVTHGVTGFLVDPIRLAELRDTLSRLGADPVLANALGQAGHERWINQYTETGFRRRLEPLMDRLLGRESLP